MTDRQTTTADTTEEPFEVRRWRSKTVRVFAALDTMPQIVDRVLAVIGNGRIMNKTATYVHSGGLTDLSNLDHATGLHKGGHAAYPDGHHVWTDKDQSGFAVYLTHGFGNLGTMEGFSANALAHNAATEKQVRDRHQKAGDSTDFFDRRSDMTYIEITGRPGDPSRDDRIEVMDWNEHGVLRHTIVTFVEPDYCDSGRVTETNYVILGHLKDETIDPDATPTGTGTGTGTPVVRASARPTHVLDTFAVPADPDRAATLLTSVRTSARAFHEKRPNVDFAWVAEETVTRARKSI